LLAALSFAPHLVRADERAPALPGPARPELERRPELVRVRTGLGVFGAFVVSLAGGLATSGRTFFSPSSFGPFVTSMAPTTSWRAALPTLGYVHGAVAGLVWPKRWVLWQDGSATLGLSPTTGALFPPPVALGARRGVGGGFALTMTAP
jgi:hypothetical protein